MNKSLILLLGAVAAFAAERYVAIDNVCAWLNAILLTDESLAAVIFNQPSHDGNLPTSVNASSLP